MPKRIEAERLLKDSEFVRAQIDPGSVNSEERRVAILVSTETPVRRFDYWSGQYYEEVLLHGEENVDLTRAATAKLRWMHGSGQYGELPIGKLENVTLANRQLRAEAVFSQANPDADMFWRMVEEGTLTEISVGGSKMENRVTERDGSIALVEVTRWAFHEASLVDIGADPSAGIGRSKNQNQGETVNEQLEALQRQLAELQKQGADGDAIARKNQEIQVAMTALTDENKELKRVAGIRDLITAKPGIMSDDDVKRFIDDKTKNADDLARAMLDAATQSQVNVPFERGEDTPSVYAVVHGRNNEGELKRAIADSMILRAGLTLANPHKDAEMFAGASMVEIARNLIGFAGYNPNEIIKRAMSTSDFPVLLGNVANRVLVQAFEQANGTFDQWTTAVDVDDFKTRNEVNLNMFSGRLKKITEGGEKKNKETSENSEAWRIYSRGAEVMITREMLINDDLGAFNDIILGFGEMAKRTANGEAYDLLQSLGDYSGYKMADGKAIFHADHKNIGTAAALSVDSLTNGRTPMRRQTLNGDALNISPAFLMVAPELETTALQLLNSESTVGQANAGVANPFRNSLKLIVDAELAAKPWYLAANRRTIKVGYLKGTNRRPIVNEKERNLSGIKYECVFDFGVMAEDFRGLLKNAGQ